jgi:hypothetical protein
MVYRYEFGREPVTRFEPPEPVDAGTAAVALPVVPGPPPSAAQPSPAAAHPTGTPVLAQAEDSTAHWGALRDAVDELASARDGAGVDRALTAVAERIRGADDRAVVRAGLVRISWGVPLIRTRVPSAEQDAVTERLVQLAFGDRVDDLDDARRVVTTAPYPLVRAIARVAQRSGRLGALGPELTDRWLHADGGSVPDRAGPLGPALARIGITVSHELQRLILLVALVALVVALVGSFLLGARFR